MPYDVLEPLAQHIPNFVMFAARQRVDVVSTRGYIKPEEGERSLEDHKVDIVSRTYGLPDRDQPKLDEHGLLFRLDHNGDPPESRLDRWLTLQHEDELGPVFNLYLAGLMSRSSSSSFSSSRSPKPRSRFTRAASGDSHTARRSSGW